jgi:hypothetical protein
MLIVSRVYAWSPLGTLMKTCLGLPAIAFQRSIGGTAPCFKAERWPASKPLDRYNPADPPV